MASDGAGCLRRAGAALEVVGVEGCGEDGVGGAASPRSESTRAAGEEPGDWVESAKEGLVLENGGLCYFGLSGPV